jgi:hypothetical protein
MGLPEMDEGQRGRSQSGLRRLARAWQRVARPFALLLALLVLSATYFLVVTPVGLALRLARRDPLGRRLDRRARTYWRWRPPAPSLRGYFRQF